MIVRLTQLIGPRLAETTTASPAKLITVQVPSPLPQPTRSQGLRERACRLLAALRWLQICIDSVCDKTCFPLYSQNVRCFGNCSNPSGAPAGTNCNLPNDSKCVAVRKMFGEQCKARCETCTITCPFRTGTVVAGSNHTQQYQGYYGSEMQCFAAVQGAQARMQGVNGATFRDGACYAEIGAAGVTTTNSSARVCMFTVAPESAVNVLREHHGYTGRP